MIQRIQSVFLFLAVVACILTFFFPLAVFLSDLAYYKLYVYELRSMVPDSPPLFSQYYILPMAAIIIIIGLISAITIFQYKNRIRQMRLIKIAIFLNIILVAGIFLGYVGIIERQLDIAGDYGIASFFPLLTLVFLVLAYRGVRKDENLVRSADRLR